MIDRMSSRLFRRIVLPSLVASLAVMSLATRAGGLTVYDIQKEVALYGYLDQDLIPNGGQVACGPTAVVNSFVYLQNKYPDVYDTLLVPPQPLDLDGDMDVDFTDDMIAVAQILMGPGYMNTLPPGGTWHDRLIWGKQKYIEEVAPDRTEYGAQDPFPWNNVPLGVLPPPWVQPIYPTWQFLYEELVDCEDVEILINWYDGGHYVTLTSLHFDDANDDGIPQFNENAWIDYINPQTGLWGQSAFWMGTGYLETSFMPGAYISMAVKESPIPLPAAAWLGLAVLAAGLTRRSRR